MASPASVCSPEGIAGLGVHELAAIASSQVLTPYYECAPRMTASPGTSPLPVTALYLLLPPPEAHGDDHSLHTTPVSLLTTAVPGGKGKSSDHR